MLSLSLAHGRRLSMSEFDSRSGFYLVLRSGSEKVISRGLSGQGCETCKLANMRCSLYSCNEVDVEFARRLPEFRKWAKAQGITWFKTWEEREMWFDALDERG